MRIIPKKIKVKNTVWKCYSMTDVIVALVVFAIIFIMITGGQLGVCNYYGTCGVGYVYAHAGRYLLYLYL